MKLYHVNNKFYLQNGEEIDFSYIYQWQEEGMLLLIEEGENYD